MFKSDANNQTLKSLFTGTTIKHLTGRSFANYSINIPPLAEQNEIVRHVKKLFSKADRIEAQYERLKKQIETLPQAILEKAFRGELVEQLGMRGICWRRLRRCGRWWMGRRKGRGRRRNRKVSPVVTKFRNCRSGGTTI